MEGSEGSSHLFVCAKSAGDPMSLLGFPLIDSDLAETGEKVSRSDHFLVSYVPKLHDSSGKRSPFPYIRGLSLRMVFLSVFFRDQSQLELRVTGSTDPLSILSRQHLVRTAFSTDHFFRIFFSSSFVPMI